MGSAVIPIVRTEHEQSESLSNMPKSRPELGSPEFKFYSIHRIPNYRMETPIKATHYMTAFKLTTVIQSSEVRGVSADSTANSQLKSLVKKRKKCLKPLQLTWKIQGLEKTHYVKYFTDFSEKASIDSHSK